MISEGMEYCILSSLHGTVACAYAFTFSSLMSFSRILPRLFADVAIVEPVEVTHGLHVGNFVRGIQSKTLIISF